MPKASTQVLLERAELRALQAKAARGRGMEDADWTRLHVLEKRHQPARHASRMRPLSRSTFARIPKK